MPPHEDSRPWVIIDPRAGHGSGIGGFKSESEVGVALKYGHPVYFVIFFPDPDQGQTIAARLHGQQPLGVRGAQAVPERLLAPVAVDRRPRRHRPAVVELPQDRAEAARRRLRWSPARTPADHE